MYLGYATLPVPVGILLAGDALVLLEMQSLLANDGFGMG